MLLFTSGMPLSEKRNQLVLIKDKNYFLSMFQKNLKIYLDTLYFRIKKKHLDIISAKANHSLIYHKYSLLTIIHYIIFFSLI